MNYELKYRKLLSQYIERGKWIERAEALESALSDLQRKHNALKTKVRVLHFPTTLKIDQTTVQLCSECSQEYPCTSIRYLEDVNPRE